MSASCKPWSNCLLRWAVDSCILRWGIISSSQSAVTSEIAKVLLVSCKKCCSKCWTLFFIFFPFIDVFSVRFVVVCGDGEYIVYTAMALRNKSFGQAQEFVWSHDSSQYAIREGSSTVQIFKNFKEQKSFKPDFGAEGLSLIFYVDRL